MPISTSAHTDVLDYFSKDPVEPGCIVQISLRKKIINGLVLTVRPLADAKHSIKQSRFALKKITKVVGPSPISATTLQAIQSVARYVATAPGIVVANSVPSWLLESKILPRQSLSQQSVGSTHILQVSLSDRVQYYKEQVHAGKRLLIICATEHQRHIIAALASDIPVFHIPQKPSQKKLSALFEKLEAQHPVLVLASPSGIGLVDVLVPDAVVIEHESDNRYVRQKIPHLDMRIIIEQIARGSDIPCIIADTLPRAYTSGRVDVDEVKFLKEPVWPEFNTVSVVSHAKDPEVSSDNRNPFFSNDLLNVLQQHANEKIVVYVPRKGLAPVVVCQDCGTAMLCSICGLPQRLIEKKDTYGNRQRMFACAHKEHIIPAHDVCATCGGHRLQGLGVSTLSVRDAVHDVLPNIPLLVLDQDEAPKESQQKDIVTKFLETPGAVLIATSMVIPYLNDTITSVIIPSFDMLLAHPSPEAQESIMHTVAALSEATKAPITIQTRIPSNPLFTKLHDHNVKGWFADEIALRKQYNFPPHNVWLSVHARFLDSGVPTFQNVINTLPIQPYTTVIARTVSRQLHGKAIYRIPHKQWNSGSQETTIAHALTSLPPGYWVEYSTNLS